MTETDDKLKDIQEHPKNHQHDFEGLVRCCTTGVGIDSRLMEAHEKFCSVNGGKRCDVTEGPCSCGAWH